MNSLNSMTTTSATSEYDHQGRQDHGASWDCVDKDGKLKSNLSMDGQYVATEDGPKWYEQVMQSCNTRDHQSPGRPDQKKVVPIR